MRGRGAFDDEEDIEQQKSSSDAEFTLGAGTLVLVLGGLIVMAGVCFGLGYMAGRRGTSAPAAQQAVETQTVPEISGSQQKPSAITQAPAAAPEQTESQTGSTSQRASTDLPPSAATGAGPDSSAQSGGAQTAPQHQVAPPPLPEPARQQTPGQTPQQQAKPQPTPQSTPPFRAGPAESETQSLTRSGPKSSTSGLWVQVAAVSHVEDAQVLTAALRRRGYVVTPRRESDNLIHVRIGPFGTRDEANRWSMKLLDDGYNAEVQQ
jgi:cell division septation protein DedD